MTPLLLLLTSCTAGKLAGVDPTPADDTGTATDSAPPCTPVAWYPDADGDGYGGVDATVTTACDQPTGLVSDGGDCDEADAAIHPYAEDVCADGIDQNCSGEDRECGVYSTDESEGVIFDVVGEDILRATGTGSAGLLAYNVDYGPCDPGHTSYVVARGAADGCPGDKYVDASVAGADPFALPDVTGDGLGEFVLSGVDLYEDSTLSTDGVIAYFASPLGEARTLDNADRVWSGMFFGFLPEGTADGEPVILARGASATYDSWELWAVPTASNSGVASEQASARIVMGSEYYSDWDAGPDVNGDGLSDVLSADAWYAESDDEREQGRVSLVLGPIPEGEHTLEEVVARSYTGGNLDHLGYAGARIVGDLTGDGLPDLVLGSQNFDDPSGTGGGWLVDPTFYVVDPTTPSGYTADVSVANLHDYSASYTPRTTLVFPGGDLDGDGRDDLLFSDTTLEDGVVGGYDYYEGILAMLGPFSGSYEVLAGPGTVVFPYSYHKSEWAGLGDAYSADFDGDGWLDVGMPTAFGRTSAFFAWFGPFEVIP